MSLVHVRILAMQANYSYFDHAATTPVDERVLAAMLPYFSTVYGNPSSVHQYGQAGESALANARARTAGLLKCEPEQVIFTSGASESNNLGLTSLAFTRRKQSGANILISTAVEHPSVLKALRWLESAHGFELKLVPVDAYGQADPDDLRPLLSERVAFVSMIFANNEVGTINPIQRIGDLCREHGIPLHSDATQATAYLAVDQQSLPVDFLTLGAHKFYGPKGVGVFIRPATSSMSPLSHGGSQEHGLRPGTENVALIIGFAEALDLAIQLREGTARNASVQRDRIIRFVLERIEGAVLTGHPVQRLPHHASFAFDHLESNALLAALDLEGFACSAGSACKVGDPQPSSVLLAMGLEGPWALGSLRISLGRATTDDAVERFCEVLPGIIDRLRAAHIAKVV
jgi:cysteine desulfurase